MEAGERTILATLAYYGALRWPLTAVELSQRLIPPTRLGGDAASVDIGYICSATDRLAPTGLLRADSGLFIVGDHPGDLVGHRSRRHAVTAQKWRDMLTAARWLQAVPFVRMLAASGSLALGSCGEQSDWDMFCIVRKRRLYTARLGLLLIAGMQGRLRTKGMRVAPDRFCFNHLITTDGLSLRHRSLFTAHALAWLVPFYDPTGCAMRLRQANKWVGEFVTYTGDEHFVRRELSHSRLLGFMRRTLELILSSYIGDATEYLLQRWMLRRIRREPATYEPGGRIVADTRELEFHPHSFEAVALARYNASLKRLGLGQFAEHDSGLHR